MDYSKYTISDLAYFITRDWKNIAFGAKPYLAAMHTMTNINDSFGYDDGKSIVRYFLSNAISWKGEVARAIKSELKNRLK